MSLIDRDAGSAETGFLFLPTAWGRGYASEAMAAIIAHAYGALALRRLTARIHAGNDKAPGAWLDAGWAFKESGNCPRYRASELRACALYGLNRSAMKNGA